jgi:hypothetical protein
MILVVNYMQGAAGGGGGVQVLHPLLLRANYLVVIGKPE